MGYPHFRSFSAICRLNPCIIASDAVSTKTFARREQSFEQVRWPAVGKNTTRQIGQTRNSRRCGWAAPCQAIVVSETFGTTCRVIATGFWPLKVARRDLLGHYGSPPPPAVPCAP